MDKVEYNQPPPYAPYGNGQNPPMPGIHIPPPQNFTNTSVPTQDAQFSYGPTITTTRVINSPGIIVVGNCPSCRIGVLEDNFPAVAICVAICFFPLGVLCCFFMKNQRCSHCGITIG